MSEVEHGLFVFGGESLEADWVEFLDKAADRHVERGESGGCGVLEVGEVLHFDVEVEVEVCEGNGILELWELK